MCLYLVLEEKSRHSPTLPRGADHILQSLQDACVNFHQTFFFPPRSPERTKREGGEGRRGEEQEGRVWGRGTLTSTRLIALVGTPHRDPYVFQIKAGSAVCANTQRDQECEQIGGYNRVPWGKGREGGGNGDCAGLEK